MGGAVIIEEPDKTELWFKSFITGYFKSWVFCAYNVAFSVKCSLKWNFLIIFSELRKPNDALASALIVITAGSLEVLWLQVQVLVIEG